MNSNKQKAFSLVETLTVISIFSVIALVVIFLINNDTKNQAILEKAEGSMLHALEIARSRAATGVNAVNHGVKIEQEKFIIFEGDEYTGTNGFETIFPSSVSTDQLELTIVFERINALPDTDATFILEHTSGIQKIITITEDGRIISQ